MAKTNKTYVSFAEYTAAKDYAYNAKVRYAERKALLEKADEMLKNVMPEVGMGCTEILYSDYRAKTIVEVITPNKIVVKENNTKCLDYYGDRYEILPTINENMSAEVYTRRRNGRWVMEGQPCKSGSVFLTLAYQRHSIDPSF